MVTEVYSHIFDEDRRKNAQLIEAAFYNKKNINPDMKGQMGESKENENKITIPEGVDANLLMKVLGNPEMAALITSLAKTMKKQGYKEKERYFMDRNIRGVSFFLFL